MSFSREEHWGGLAHSPALCHDRGRALMQAWSAGGAGVTWGMGDAGVCRGEMEYGGMLKRCEGLRGIQRCTMRSSLALTMPGQSPCESSPTPPRLISSWARCSPDLRLPGDPVPGEPLQHGAAGGPGPAAQDHPGGTAPHHHHRWARPHPPPISRGRDRAWPCWTLLSCLGVGRGGGSAVQRKGHCPQVCFPMPCRTREQDRAVLPHPLLGVEGGWWCWSPAVWDPRGQQVP